jgi:hypothetical protein
MMLLPLAALSFARSVWTTALTALPSGPALHQYRRPAAANVATAERRAVSQTFGGRLVAALGAIPMDHHG